MNLTANEKNMIDKGSRFYNRPKVSYLQDNDIEIYSAHSEGKPVIALLKTIFTNARLEY